MAKKATKGVDKAAFKSAMAATNQACSAMEYNNNWVPPEGNYDVQLVDVTIGEKVDDKGVKNFWLRPKFEIITEGEHLGRAFTDFFYINPAAPTVDYGKGPFLVQSLRSLLFLGTCLAGRELQAADEAFEIISGSIGEFLSLKRIDKPGKGKNAGKVYENIQYQNKLESSEVAEEEVAAS